MSSRSGHSAEVTLSDGQVAEAVELAEKTYSQWKGVHGHYRNTLESHRTGKLGEIGVEAWANAQFGPGRIDSAFRDLARSDEADIFIDAIRVEVKTWSSQYWADWGRCVHPAQAPGIRRKADRVVWCHWSESTRLLTVAGWSTLEEIEALPISMTGPAHRLIPNHQMPLDEIRSLDEFPTT